MCLSVPISFECEIGNKTEYLIAAKKTPQQFQENPIIHWEAIAWVCRPTFLWVIEIIFALINLTEALLMAYLNYKVRRLEKNKKNNKTKVTALAAWSNVSISNDALNSHFVTKTL